MQIRPEEWRIIKDIWDAVICSADIIRSPSFSRWGLSRTIMNSLFPFYRRGLVGLYVSVCVCVGRGGRGGGGGGWVDWESIRKASIVSVMESNWRASEDAWSRVPFMRGLGWTPFRMGDATGGILSEDVIFIRPLRLCVYVYVCMYLYGKVQQGGFYQCDLFPLPKTKEMRTEDGWDDFLTKWKGGTAAPD